MSGWIEELDEDERRGAREASMPEWIDPMLAELTHDHFSGEDWLFERKLDGERVLAWIRPDGRVRLLSRNEKRLNDSYPEIEEGLAEQAPRGCILDGEVVAFDEDGVSDFQKLQPRMKASGREAAEASGVEVHYYLFDCLYLDGHDVTGCGLRARKKLLKEAVEWGGPVRWTPHRNDDGLEYYREACSRGWEGLIAKRAGSAYANGRSSEWLKFKCVMRQEFVIGGFTEPEGARVGFGALQIGFYRDGDLVYAGDVGTGFTDETLKELGHSLEELEVEESPFDAGEPETKGVHFVEPELVCEVEFSEWTDDDRLRHPRYEGLRRDKDPRDVRREVETRVAEPGA